MKGICVDQGLSVNLKIDEEYFLFTYGPNHYYASRFNNKGAHFGVYQKKYFELIQETPLTQQERLKDTQKPIIQESNGEWEQLALF